ncbi:MAG TPA: metallophosphoesterase [Candidatus Dormibacteraeota bacterium]|nr:metallophosphoesterase [Candidatus Dormibacteraeota bacterium]
MTRILAVADEVDESLYGDKLATLAPDLVVSCGDLPFDYLEYLVSRANVPLLYVPGNHDPNVKPPDTTWVPLQSEIPVPGPQGCDNVDGRVLEVNGLRIAGLGGSLRYKEGPNQYSQAQMLRRAIRLELWIRLKRVRAGRKLDVLVTHAPPFGVAEAKDATHEGFKAFNRLFKEFHPLLLVHGHVHPYGRNLPELHLDGARIVNAIPSRLIEI